MATTSWRARWLAAIRRSAHGALALQRIRLRNEAGLSVIMILQILYPINVGSYRYVQDDDLEVLQA